MTSLEIYPYIQFRSQNGKHVCPNIRAKISFVVQNLLQQLAGKTETRLQAIITIETIGKVVCFLLIILEESLGLIDFL
jgi:hypothetical protein